LFWISSFSLSPLLFVSHDWFPSCSFMIRQKYKTPFSSEERGFLDQFIASPRSVRALNSMYRDHAMLIYCIMTLASNLLLMLTMLEANKQSVVVANNLSRLPSILKATKVRGPRLQNPYIVPSVQSLPLVFLWPLGRFCRKFYSSHWPTF
jgi:hypothetical protein